MTERELVIIGGGPAGLAAAVAAYEKGVRDILILERDHCVGGILNQCIHNGFGLHYFKEELTGPEYAGRFADMVAKTSAEVMTDTMVLSLTKDRILYALNAEKGYFAIKAGAVVLAMGCRERTRGAIAIPGDRPAGVLTAGTAQRYMNIEGYSVGKRVVILGSGDIGLIMARRMTLEGAKVLAVVELMPYSNGLSRNVVQCLEDYDIPLYLAHTVTDIRGKGRLEKIVVSRVDENRNPIPGTEMEFECDTLLLSVGLIPENELTRGADIEMDRGSNGACVTDIMETSAPGVFACGNVLHVHDLVDFVTAESMRAGESAAAFLLGEKGAETLTPIAPGENVGYTVPQKADLTRDGAMDIFFRSRRIFHGADIVVRGEKGEILLKKHRPHILPAEMEKLTVSREKLRSAGSLTVSIEEAAQ